MNSAFKKNLFDYCCNILKARIDHAQLAMLDAQESANAEEKSSAGDKYETGRAMSQLARDMNAKQLAEARKDLVSLSKLKDLKEGDMVYPGSLVHASKGMYFIATGIGPVTLGDQQVTVLSPVAPLSKLLIGKKAGDNILINGKEVLILKVL